MEIRIYKDADYQFRRLKDNVTIDTAKKMVDELVEEDYLGCDLFELADENEEILYSIEQ